jgi:hypothetical protein
VALASPTVVAGEGVAVAVVRVLWVRIRRTSSS